MNRSAAVSSEIQSNFHASFRGIMPNNANPAAVLHFKL